MMKRFLWTAVVAVSMASCAADGGEEPFDQGKSDEEVTELGNLSLSLSSADSRGRQYRLRNASFYISNNYYPYFPGDIYDSISRPYDAGPGFSTVISSEDDPDASSISLRLIPGSYYVTLGGDWYLERVTPAGVERVMQAVLLSPPDQYAYVYQNGLSGVAFRFGVDGELIDFRHGQLDIDIEIELPGESDYDGGPRRDAGRIGDAGVGMPFPPF